MARPTKWSAKACVCWKQKMSGGGASNGCGRRWPRASPALPHRGHPRTPVVFASSSPNEQTSSDDARHQESVVRDGLCGQRLVLEPSPVRRAEYSRRAGRLSVSAFARCMDRRLQIHLLPGFTGGRAARSGGRLSGEKVSTFSLIRLNSGTPRFTSPLERSTTIPTPTTAP
jgi:hypothetical protein